tara:strand:+ start:10609 stop:11016 length:408 start_codon:yes stop_codon:yes gene_type:complete
MSNNWVKDIAEMHTKYGTNKAVRSMDNTQLRSFLKFRIDFLQEELDELNQASKPGIPIDQPEVVDALIDLCVVAIGTLDAFDVDAYHAWDVVHNANMNKEVGVKESRPNPLGLPDLIKPEGWVAPEHDSNTGLLP